MAEGAPNQQPCPRPASAATHASARTAKHGLALVAISRLLTKPHHARGSQDLLDQRIGLRGGVGRAQSALQGLQAPRLQQQPRPIQSELVARRQLQGVAGASGTVRRRSMREPAHAQGPSSTSEGAASGGTEAWERKVLGQVWLLRISRHESRRPAFEGVVGLSHKHITEHLHITAMHGMPPWVLSSRSEEPRSAGATHQSPTPLRLGSVSG